MTILDKLIAGLFTILGIVFLLFIDVLFPLVAHRECIDGKGLLTAMCAVHGLGILLVVFGVSLVSYHTGRLNQ